MVPLCVDEPRSRDMLSLLKRDRTMVVWWFTSIECWSAICRRTRERVLSQTDREMAQSLVDKLASSWNEILATNEVRDHARRLLRRHPLRAADSIQLAAAMVWAEGKPEAHRFACLDDRLAKAAVAEGFVIEP